MTTSKSFRFAHDEREVRMTIIGYRKIPGCMLIYIVRDEFGNDASYHYGNVEPVDDIRV